MRRRSRFHVGQDEATVHHLSWDKDFQGETVGMLMSDLEMRFREMAREVDITTGKSFARLGLEAVRRGMRLRRSQDPIAPILRTALVINWREELMRPRY